MAGSKLRWLTVGLMASASAGLLSLTSIMNSAFAYADSDLAVPLIIGGSSIPVPPPDYIDDAFTKFLEPHFDVGTTPPPNGLFTPEGLYPIYAPPGPGSSIVKQLPFETSVYQGRQILDQTVINDVNNLHEHVAIYGESQSATISGLSMTDLAAAHVSSSDVGFALVGDPDTPFGGLLTRFAASDVPGLLRPELTIPSLGIPFYGATPDDVYPTFIYTQEYDGFADFPRYPLDLLSDLNAFLGIQDVHPTYRDLLSEYITNLSGLQKLPVLDPSETMTTYYYIPMQDEAGLNAEYIPLLQPLAGIPVIGKPLADLLQPDLMALVNLGYGSPLYGVSVNPVDGGYANVTQPFGLFPSLTDFEQLPGVLVSGTEQGISKFISDITHLSLPSLSLPALATMVSNPMAALSTVAASLSPAGILTDLQNGVTSVGNAFTAAASAAYATLLPTADIGNAIVTTLPLYDFNLFVDGIQEVLGGDPAGLLDAVGLPVAADTALLTLAAGFEFTAVLNQVESIVGDFTALIP